ncbi:hypothetical protein HHUSO_G6522 [Huso huso]|uniref:Uncharacterized protein n=1 Tax=Huso huso TaxID=61971 RepID=A0ABR0ZXV1_HUSHU
MRNSMEQGKSYILKDYGLVPPNGLSKPQIHLRGDTLIFTTSEVKVSEDVATKGQLEIEPFSQELEIGSSQTGTQLVSLTGKVITGSTSMSEKKIEDTILGICETEDSFLVFPEEADELSVPLEDLLKWMGVKAVEEVEMLLPLAVEVTLTNHKITDLSVLGFNEE